jgi:chaperone required for assembly of F1-ATPase
MRDILYPDDPEQPKDAYVSIRKSMEKPLPKRFYRQAGIEPADGGWRIVLDGRPARTPARYLLALPNEQAAAIVAAEWQAAGEVIDPGRMPATRIANVGIDRVGAVRDAVIEDIVKYARSDLVCYRAADPEGLVEQENRHWTPILDHLREQHRAVFVLSEGIGFATQPETAVDIVRGIVGGIAEHVALAAFHTMTSIAGSVLIPVALKDGVLDAEASFDAASVEEDWNAHLWGADLEATERRARRRAEFLAAAALFKALE